MALASLETPSALGVTSPLTWLVRSREAVNSSRATTWRSDAPGFTSCSPRWTFITDPAVEPTNNPAERALRGPVIHRKLSHGTRSDQGERFAERALSAATTCRQQDRSLFGYLAQLLAAHTRGDPIPALT